MNNYSFMQQYSAYAIIHIGNENFKRKCINILANDIIQGYV